MTNVDWVVISVCLIVYLAVTIGCIIILLSDEWNIRSEAINGLKSLRPSKDCSDCAKHLKGYISGRCDAENKLLEQFGALISPEDELHIKPRWKPSEEQMEVFFKATPVNLMPDELGVYHSLYNDLQKLL